VTGLRIEEVLPKTWVAFDGDTEVARYKHFNQSYAIRMLVESVLKQTNLRVFEEQGWRCHSCGRYSLLQGHHVIKRSHGRSDAEENIRGLCAQCHDLVERGVIKV
jgi:5-methylcytosine-specific restriction endonuclease McrA